MLSEQTTVLPVPGLTVHWLEVLGIIMAIALGKVFDARIANPKIKKERNDELDTRLNSIRQAINSSTDLIQQDVVTLTSDLRAVKGTVDVVAVDVKGLKDRELARLEADAGPTRRSKH